MTKRQIIDEIMDVNPTAGPDFLAQFRDDDLLEYLRHLNVLRMPFSNETPEQFVPDLAVMAGPVGEQSPAAAADCPAAAGPEVVQRHRVRRFFADMPTPPLHSDPTPEPEADVVSMVTYEPVEEPIDETPNEAAFEEPVAEPEAEIVSMVTYEPVEEPVDETPVEANLVAAVAVSSAQPDDDEAMQDSWLF